MASLLAAIDAEIPKMNERASHPAVGVVVAQMAFLCGQGIGPSEETIEKYEAWIKT